MANPGGLGFPQPQTPPLRTVGAAPVITVSTVLSPFSPKLLSVEMAATFQSITLPPALRTGLGGDIYLINNTGSNTFAIRDNNGRFLRTLVPGGRAEVSLLNNTTVAGQWIIAGSGL